MWDEAAYIEISKSIEATTICRVKCDNCNTWEIQFVDNSRLEILGLWRLIDDDNLCSTSEDHEKVFYLERQFDGIKALSELVGLKIVKCKILESTGDIDIEFEDQFILQIISTSAGNDNWKYYSLNGKIFIAKGYSIFV